MRIKLDDLILLDSIYGYLVSNDETELSAELIALLHRIETEREQELISNRERAAKNRAAGYVWKSSYHPKRSKYMVETCNV